MNASSMSTRGCVLALVLAGLIPAVVAEEHDRPAAAGAPAPTVKESKPGDGTAKKDDDDDAKGGAAVVIPADALGALGIAVATPARRALSDPVRAAGLVVYDPDAQVLVQAPVPGRIVRLAVHAGDVVKAGQDIAEIASPDFVRAENEFVTKTAALAAAQASAQAARQSWERAQRLPPGDLSAGENQRRESEAAQTLAAAQVATAERDAAAVTLRLMGLDAAALDRLLREGAQATFRIVTPLAGTVIERDVVVGSQVGPDGKPVAMVADPSRLWIVAEIPEARLAAVTLGSQAIVSDHAGKQIADGDVAYVHPAIDPRTRTGKARISVASAGALRVGQLIQVAITPLEDEAGAQVLAVPESAVIRLGERSAVITGTLDKGSWTFRAHPVVAGVAVGGWVPLAGGLDDDDHVVVAGTGLLKAELGKPGADND